MTTNTDTTKLDAAVWRALEYLEEGGVPDAFDGDAPVADQAAALLTELVRIAAVRADRLANIAALPVLPDVGPVTRAEDSAFTPAARWVAVPGDRYLICTPKEAAEMVAAGLAAMRDFDAEAADTSSDDEDREVRAVDLTQPHSGRLWTVSRVGQKAQWGDGLYLTEGEAQAALDAHRAARTSEEARS